VLFCLPIRHCLDDEVGDAHTSVELSTFTKQLLAVPCQDALARAEALWVQHNRCLCEWDVWAVEVSAVHVAVALVAHQNLVRREQWVFVQSPTVVHSTYILDTQGACERLARSRCETCGCCLKDRGNFRAGDEPVGSTTQ